MSHICAKAVLRGTVSIAASPSTAPAKLTNATVTPSQEAQVLQPPAGYAGFSTITVEPIPTNYGKIVYDGARILIE